MNLFISFIVILKFGHVIATNLVFLKPMQSIVGSLGYFNSEIVYGYRLNIQPILTISVKDASKCLQHCLKEDNTCLTFNVLNDASIEMKQCELLDTDVFANEIKFIKDESSTHYGLQTKCWEEPCYNRASCIPDYQKDTFKCNCTHGYVGFLCEQPLLPERSCRAFYSNGHRTDGIYPLLIPNNKVNNVFCDMKNGGWIVIQRRMDGSVSFEKTWLEYKEGFGDPSGDYWLGNEAIHQLTKNSCELNITMVYNGTNYYAYYSSFQVSDEGSKYTLHIDGFQGNVRDELSSHHNNRKFTTMDQDNDNAKVVNCAQGNKGGWWYEACFRVKLNGVWKSLQRFKGIIWRDITTLDNSLDYVVMEILCPL